MVACFTQVHGIYVGRRGPQARVESEPPTRVSPEMRLLALVSLAIAVSAVKEHDFRKCRDTPFCGRHREPPAAGAEPFRVGSVSFLPVEGATRANECSGLTATLVAPDATRAQLPLVLSLSVLATGAVRVLIDEDSSISSSELHRSDPSVARPAEWDEDMDGAWDAPMLKLGRAVKGRFAPTDALASPGVLAPVKCEYHTMSPARPTDGGEKTMLRCAAEGGEVVVRLVHSPFSVELLGEGPLGSTSSPVAVLNGRGRLMFESFKQQMAAGTEEPVKPEPIKFHSFEDAQPFGPSSVGVDIDFPQATCLAEKQRPSPSPSPSPQP